MPSGSCALSGHSCSQRIEKRPNIVMLMTDHTGWSDFGAYSGSGSGLGHPTPAIDQIANTPTIAKFFQKNGHATSDAPFRAISGSHSGRI